MSQYSTSKVDLTLSGRQSLIKSIRRQDVRVNVDLENLTPGRHHISLGGKNVYLPSGIKIDQIAPRKIEVILDRVQKTEDRRQKTEGGGQKVED